VVVGRDPPASLRALAHATSGISFTGFVDDVRPYVRAAHVCTIPLRIGGGTRIKAFEAMAMGCPVVSTSIGIEGLEVRDGDHFLKRDLATEQAAAIVGLLHDRAWRDRLSRHARDCVEQHFGHRVAARAFEHACQTAMAVHAARRGSA
jgi:glycosyltransferase involved in cell wall biosynthesis